MFHTPNDAVLRVTDDMHLGVESRILVLVAQSALPLNHPGSPSDVFLN